MIAKKIKKKVNSKKFFFQSRKNISYLQTSKLRRSFLFQKIKTIHQTLLENSRRNTMSAMSSTNRNWQQKGIFYKQKKKKELNHSKNMNQS